MSDWEIVDRNQESFPFMKPPIAESEWEVVQNPARHSQFQRESLLEAIGKAPFRIGEDIYKTGMGFIKNIPSYLEQAKTEVPGLFQTAREHPGHLAMQGLAGTQEGINKLAQFPLELSKYGSERLNLIPESVTQAISKVTPENTNMAIEQLFGQPQYPGEALTRGAFRNIPEIATGAKALNFVNPLNYTAKNISRNIVETGEKQYLSHQKRYNDLWEKAEKAGINEVPYDTRKILNNYQIIEKYKTPREYQSLVDFANKPTLSNAQKAQSDMSIIHRNLADKSRKGSLTSEEKALFNAAKDTEKHIEDNMFRDTSGKVNEKLKNQYKNISSSYRENVVPYKYNPNIQAFKNTELLPKELVERLKRGEFAAKKGKAHPELFRSQQIRNALKGIGLVGAGAIGGQKLSDYLYNK